MSDKSYVSIEKKQCPICGTLHNVGILLDKRLRNSMEQSTVTGYDLCPEHKELHEKGFIALVVPAVSPTEGVTHLKVETARSGKYLHIKREVLKNILVNVSAEHIELPMLFIDEDTFNWFEQQTNQNTEE
jgi:hypothetical protein